MEKSKKSSKKSFAVPAVVKAKDVGQETTPETKQEKKPSAKAGKENKAGKMPVAKPKESMKPNKDTTLKEKKSKVNVLDGHKEDAGVKAEKKPRKRTAEKKNVRSLTDAEYVEIFKAVIDVAPLAELSDSDEEDEVSVADSHTSPTKDDCKEKTDSSKEHSKKQTVSSKADSQNQTVSSQEDCEEQTDSLKEEAPPPSPIISAGDDDVSNVDTKVSEDGKLQTDHDKTSSAERNPENNPSLENKDREKCDKEKKTKKHKNKLKTSDKESKETTKDNVDGAAEGENKQNKDSPEKAEKKKKKKPKKKSDLKKTEAENKECKENGKQTEAEHKECKEKSKKTKSENKECQEKGKKNEAENKECKEKGKKKGGKHEKIQDDAMKKKDKEPKKAEDQNQMENESDNESCVVGEDKMLSGEQDSASDAAARNDTHADSGGDDVPSDDDEKEEEKKDTESVVSDKSISSSLMDMASEVDQWDRPGEVQESNERTPRGSDAEADPQADPQDPQADPQAPQEDGPGVAHKEGGGPGVAHKPKKSKQRKNELAPRKLCFDTPDAKKTEAPSKAESKKKGELKTLSVPEFHKKKKKLAERQDEDIRKHRSKATDPDEVPADMGTWVQCCEEKCKKWRYLPDIHDPSAVHDLWVCNMHPDTLFNSCSKAEQEYDESDHILTEFTLGSLVWAKMDGFPWWPGIIDVDPDYDTYCELPHENSMVPTDYHVVFLDEKVTRSWVKNSRVKHLQPQHLVVGSVYLRGHKYKKDVGVSMRKAEVALNLPLQERLNKFGFAACFKNQHTRWSQAVVKKKAPKQKKKHMKGSHSDAVARKPMAAKKIRDRTPDSDSDEDTDSPSAASSSDESSESDREAPTHSSHKKTLSKKSHKKKLLLSPLNKFFAQKKSKETNVKVEKKKEKTEVKSTEASKKRPKKSKDKAGLVTEKAATVSLSDVKKKRFQSKMAKKRDADCQLQREEKKESPAADKEMDAESVEEQGSTTPTKRKHDESSLTDSDERPNKKMKVDKDKLKLKKTSDQESKKEKKSATEPTSKIKFKAPAKLVSDKASTKKNKAVTPASVTPTKQEHDETPEQEKPSEKSKASIDATLPPAKKVKKVKKAAAPIALPAKKPVVDTASDSDSDDSDSPPAKKAKKAISPSEDSNTPPAENVEKTSSPSPHPAEEKPAPDAASDSDSDDSSSPLLNRGSKDQFVPSLSGEDDDDDNSNVREIVLHLGDLSPKDSRETGRGMVEVKGCIEDSDSDCLDIETDLPIPSLQSVISVERKGSSDQECDSDPMEGVED